MSKDILIKKTILKQIKKLPKTPGVYLFCGKKGEIIYIGKAKNIRKRVSSHFKKPSDGNVTKEKMVSFARKIKFIETESEIDAIIEESALIKRYLPKYNIALRDDKSFWFVQITNEPFPKISLVHHKMPKKSKKQNKKYRLIGPFTDGKSLKTAMRLLRRVFPFRHCETMPKTACLQYHLKRCGGFCEFHLKKSSVKTATAPLANQYKKDLKNLIAILSGKKQNVLRKWTKDMKKESNKKNFERAAKIRDEISALNKIFAHSPIVSIVSKETDSDSWTQTEQKLKKILRTKKNIKKIETYDISNISGESASGSLVVFENGKPSKKNYRKFKIKSKNIPNDPAMIKEIVLRRFRHKEWGFPDIIFVDGGLAQLKAAKQAIPAGVLVCSIAKNPDRIFYENKKIPLINLSENLKIILRQMRDEAHRFAISYHKKIRAKKMFGNS